MEGDLIAAGVSMRVVEDCLNGRRTVWEDPFKPGRKGIEGIEQRIEVNSPLSLVILMLGTNDFQSIHSNNAWHSAQGIGAIIGAIRGAPIEPGMPEPRVLVVAPPPIQEARRAMAEKFAGANRRCAGVAGAYERVASELGCAFFDAASVVTSSPIDGVHLDADQHGHLGHAIASEIGPLLMD